MYFIYFALAFLVSISSTKALINFLFKRNIIDVPNHRSNHKAPIPRGGGVAIISAVLVGVAFFTWQYGFTTNIVYFVLAIFIAAGISLWDDISGASILVRVIFQSIAVYWVMRSLPLYDHTLLFHLLPLSIEKFLAGLALLLFINLYNFMDGIDGLTASETIYISIFVLVVSFFGGRLDEFTIYLCISVIGACLGFVVFNWHPARIFMGDVGSISLGLICGWLLLDLAVNGYVIAAIIVPGYYLADSLTTIVMRLIRKQKIWQAHSEHFFQKAVRRGKTHSQVTRKIIFCNVILFSLGLLSLVHSYIALIAASLFIIVFLRRVL